MLDDDAYWHLVAQLRHDLATFLESLTAEQWETPSLCAAWRVRDVAAHVAQSPQVRRGPLIRATARARGNPLRTAAEMAIRHAARPTAQIVQEIHDHAEHRGLSWPLDGRNVLFDVLVHGKDIGLPLGIDRPMDPAAAREGLERVWVMGWPFRANRRFTGVRLRATDTEWAAGDGPEVSGRTEDLLMLATGRLHVVKDRLSGPGIGALVGHK